MTRRPDILVASLVLFAASLPEPIIAGSTDSSDGEAAVSNPFAGRADVASQGKTLFNVHCSHCHGPNAVQGEKRRDLRRLRGRYGEELPVVFIETASNGRPDRGMPAWEGVVEKEELWKILTFLETVQNE